MWVYCIFGFETFIATIMSWWCCEANTEGIGCIFHVVHAQNCTYLYITWAHYAVDVVYPLCCWWMGEDIMVTELHPCPIDSVYRAWFVPISGFNRSIICLYIMRGPYREVIGQLSVPSAFNTPTKAGQRWLPFRQKFWRSHLHWKFFLA